MTGRVLLRKRSFWAISMILLGLGVVACALLIAKWTTDNDWMRLAAFAFIVLLLPAGVYGQWFAYCCPWCRRNLIYHFIGLFGPTTNTKEATCPHCHHALDDEVTEKHYYA